jgi:E3 ubiquitin-protein ligase CCNP1IP1
VGTFRLVGMMAVADDSLVCNFKKCRKRLNTFAWATSCSRNGQSQSTAMCDHTCIFIIIDVFCDEDGTREFNKTCKCPACDTELPGKYDIVRVDLQPSEDYKSVYDE